MKIGDKVKLSPSGKERYRAQERDSDYGIITDINPYGSWDCEVDWYINKIKCGGYCYMFSHLELIEQNYQIY